MLNRRSFLLSASTGLAASLISTRSVYAAAPTDSRMVIVVLRGALDGLHALVPYADADYTRLRPSVSPLVGNGAGIIDLDGYFGMHKAFEPLEPMYRAGELLFVPASATQYRERSHFDGQNLLENGSGAPFGSDTGWLNRAIMGLNDNDRRLGLSIGPAVPLILRGDADVQTWADSGLPSVDEDFLMRVMRTYQHDALFLDALHDAQGVMDPSMMTSDMAGARGNAQFARAAEVTAQLLARADGPRIAVMEIGGWDTHFNQEGRLNTLFGQLAAGIVTLKDGLGDAWGRTSVMVVSEFGRTAAQNGSGGTDHGTGGLAILAGGAVNGGRIGGRWPGLSASALWQDRDVRALNSIEAMFKSALIGHMGLTPAFFEETVFPASRDFAPMEGLLRSV